jgi:hypothetical protein
MKSCTKRFAVLDQGRASSAPASFRGDTALSAHRDARLRDGRWHQRARQLAGNRCPRFSNRPFGVKRFQTIHPCSVDVSHGLVLLFGIGTVALPSWGSRTRRNDLWVGLAVRRRQAQADVDVSYSAAALDPQCDSRVSVERFISASTSHEQSALSLNYARRVWRHPITTGRLVYWAQPCRT